MRTLLAKLAGALLLVLLLAGSALFWLQQYSSRAYYEELTQRLNAPIAMYVTGEQLLIENHQAKTAALRAVAHQAMVINPTIEVYLLDTEGRILAHALPPDSVKQDHVDLAPVKRFIGGDADIPIRGSDPRSPTDRKIFSAAEVRAQGQLQGYLYAVLGGQKYEQLADSIRDSYVLTLSLGAIFAIITTAFLVALLVFGLLTRRLARLTEQVQRYTDSDFDPTTALSTSEARGDEIDRLGNAFSMMSSRIQQQFERLKETDRLRRELVSNVSHDLRTPVAAIQGYVETLLLKNDTLSVEERAHYLEVSRKHTRRLGRLIGDLFELSKLESASVTPQFEAFSLAELLQDVMQEFELAAADKGVHMEMAGMQAPMAAVADIGLVQRVLENLLKNALENTPSGGQVIVGVTHQSKRVAVTVTDTGCGIPDDELPLIFDRFYHAHKDCATGPGCSGLGLAIVKRILDLHGSHIFVTSKVSQGTCFEFDLPTAAAA
ncbi:MAG: HAMP domain-containing sensor histidine kinase [Sedimenticolaceae bacterium]